MSASTSIAFACPRCQTALEQLTPDVLCCPNDELEFRRTDGIWRMLLPEREPLFAQFRREYETIRQAEGRGDNTSEYYRALPYRDLTGRMPGDWQIRAATFNALIERVVIPHEQRLARSMSFLDMGAGNGWLSNRLAQRGHAVAAVDLSDNDFDGLGCFRFYESAFTPVQAEFDHLPFTEGSMDMVVFNASLHYSVDYATTLSEARRVLSSTGRLVVLDSPVYTDQTSGKLMVQERQEEFLHKYGFPSDALPSENFLTYRRLEELAARLNAHYQLITPSYTLNWKLRPLKARLLGRREPAKFHIIVFSSS
jgi:ubiquinone/menaquinone biosynthesis C-methylase UbiE